MKTLLIFLFAVTTLASDVSWVTTDTNICAKLRQAWVQQNETEPPAGAWLFDPEAGGRVFIGSRWTNAPSKAAIEAIAVTDPVTITEAEDLILRLLSDKDVAKELKKTEPDYAVIRERLKALKKAK